MIVGRFLITWVPGVNYLPTYQFLNGFGWLICSWWRCTTHGKSARVTMRMWSQHVRSRPSCKWGLPWTSCLLPAPPATTRPTTNSRVTSLTATWRSSVAPNKLPWYDITSIFFPVLPKSKSVQQILPKLYCLNPFRNSIHTTFYVFHDKKISKLASPTTWNG